MITIRPVSDLRNKTHEIEEICIKGNQPVFITKNGIGHLVVMSQKMFEEQQAFLEIFDKLYDDEGQSAEDRLRTFQEAVAELRNRFNVKVPYWHY